MTINDDLFRAILAMDPYNRGYNSGISFGPNSDAIGTQIGNATISARTPPGDTAAQAASFYALAYTLEQSSDHFVSRNRQLSTRSRNGWLAGGFASPFLAQPLLAAQFYQAVINNPAVSPFSPAANVEFTGHSLGSGLAAKAHTSAGGAG